MKGIGHKVEALLVIAGLIIALTYVGDGTKRTSVPSLLGLSVAKAEKRLKDRALEAEVVKPARGTQNLPRRYRVEGEIIFQDYRDGIVLPVDSKVRVMVYKPRGERR